MGDDARLEGVRLVRELREAGVRADLDHAARSLKAQFKFADKIGAGWVALVGGDEYARGVIKLLPLSSNVIVRCRNSDVARVARAVCADACIGCGRCKKECQYEAITVEGGFARIDPDKCTRCGACAAVCPCKCITID